MQQVAVLSEAAATCNVLLDPRRVLAWAEKVRHLLNAEAVGRIVTDTAWAATACIGGDRSGLDAVLAALAEGRVAASIAGLPPMLAVWTAVCAHELAMLAERFTEAEQAIKACLLYTSRCV